ncbi:hypothetical protein ALC53_12066 [Atta colombica]|uniref:Uncharacterized protein n=1 Tax=Atta colombica TaxID=520822 RepID=A0A195AZG9_9HYME|nr:hypothetical protein ALC53_12066 [Atta colombica]
MSWTGAKLASRFVSERRTLEREKAGEADRDKGKDFGAAGIACAALGQNVVLQGFVEEQFEAQERRVRTSNNNELLPERTNNTPIRILSVHIRGTYLMLNVLV